MTTKQLPFTDVMQKLLVDCLKKGDTIDEACDRIGLDSGTVKRKYHYGQANPQSEWGLFASKIEEAEKQFQFARAKEVRRELSEGKLPHRSLLIADSYFKPATCAIILEHIRSGVSPTVAAEHAGVPRLHFQMWIEWAETEPKGKYRTFYHDFLAAKAEARASAEKRVFAENPLAWLLNSPERERGDGTGWAKQQQIKQTSVNVSLITTQWGESGTPQLPEGAVEGNITVTEEESQVADTEN